MRHFVTLALTFFFFGCHRPADLVYVKSHEWIYDSGFRIGQGDYVGFPSNQSIFSLHGDTIYYNGQPRAIVVSTDEKASSLTISSIEGKVKGEYLDINMSINESK